MKQPREFMVFNGETATPKLSQIKGLPIAYAENVHLIEYSVIEPIKTERDRMTTLLNKIAIMGMGELAYTNDYFEKVNQMIQEELILQGAKPKRWPY
jgi:hypothetical protein